MPSVRVKEGEPFEAAMRRFKRAVEKAGIPKELRSRAFYQKGSVQKQRRIAAAKKRLLKKLFRERQIFDENSRDRRH